MKKRKPGTGRVALMSAVRLVLAAAMIAFALVMLRFYDARDVDFALLRPVTDAAAAGDGLKALDENGLRDRFGLDPAGCEGWALYGSDRVLTVDELLLVKAPDEDARDAFWEAAQARRDAQLALFRDYGTDQAALLERAILWQRGPYVFYAVSGEAEAWETDLLALIR